MKSSILSPISEILDWTKFFVWRKWRKYLMVTKILSDEKGSNVLSRQNCRSPGLKLLEKKLKEKSTLFASINIVSYLWRNFRILHI